MARSSFGGSDTQALAILPPSLNGGVVKCAPNLTVGTAWSAQVGGDQYVDLTLPGGGACMVRTDANGFVRAMLGPDGVNEGIWVDLGSGTRFYLRTSDPVTVAQEQVSGLVDELAGKLDETEAISTYLPQGGLPPIQQVSPTSQETIVSILDAGSGFSASNAASSNVNDTGDFVTGTQSAWAQTKGDGTETLIQNLGVPAADATDKFIKIRFKGNNLTGYNSIKFRAGNGAFSSYWEWTLALTGTSSTVDENSWQVDTLNWQTATKVGNPTRSGLTAWAIVIKDNNTGVQNVIHLDGISLVDDGGATWPVAPITITFDDSYDGVYKYARPAMDKYGFRGVVYPIWGSIGTAGRMTAAQIVALRDISGWDIGSHASTTAVHDSVNSFRDFTPAQLDTEFAAAKAAAYALGIRTSDHLAYPQSKYNDAVVLEVRKYFASARTTFSQNLETIPPANVMWLRSKTVHWDTDTVPVMKALIDAAQVNRTWLILDWHQLVTAAPGPVFEYLSSNFALVMDYIASLGIPVRTIGEVLATKTQQGTQAPSSSTGFFGDGSDGFGAFDGTTTVAGTSLAGSVYSLARDVWLTSATLSNNVTVDTSRFRLFVRDALTITAGSKISNDGNDAVTTVIGAGKGSRTAGGSGNGGSSVLSGSGNAGAGSTAALGGSGGAGGASTGGGTGGGAIGGANTNPTGQSAPRQAASALSCTPQGLAALWLAGAGGGGGHAAASSQGGAGGGGAPVLIVAARTLVNQGTISAKGGKGGDATLNAGAGAGGGGGGGGGALLLVYGSRTGTGTTDVTGGAGGALAGTGAAGAVGAAGSVYYIRA
jgi:peptidoglycan/xylan/chitin deacetylase (PgdA/CDA1 family)